jgi:hypothetical protein
MCACGARLANNGFDVLDLRLGRICNPARVNQITSQHGGGQI